MKRPDWAMVLAFLPELEALDFQAGSWRSRPGEMPYFEPSGVAERLVQAVYESGVAYDFDWVKWQDEAERLVQSDPGLGQAGLSILRKLLVLHVRKDRFCEGHFAEMLESGHVRAILRRVAVLTSTSNKG